LHQVFFNTRASLSPEERDRLLSRIRSWKFVRSADLLDPRASEPEIAKMCFAELDDEADAQAVVRELSKLPEVEAASLPAERRLL
jgi:hypothetical protein